MNENQQLETTNKLGKLREDLKKDPNNIALREFYAEQLSEKGENEESINQYKILIKLSPNKSEYYYCLGIALEKIKDMQGALEAYKKAVDIYPDFGDAHYNLAYVLDRTGKQLEAIKEYQIAINLNPKDANAHFNLGCIHSERDNAKEALEHLNIAIEINPEDEYAHFYLAFEFQKMGIIEKALQEYDTVIRINPKYSWAYYNKGYIYLSQNEKEKAFNEFKKTFEINNEDYKALQQLIAIGLDLNYGDNLLDLLEDLIIMDSKNAILHFYIAEVFSKMNLLEDAFLHYKKAYNLPNLKKSDIDPIKLREKLIFLKNKLAE